MIGYKKFALGILMAAAAVSGSAQNKSFEKISKLPEAQYAYISESMLSSMGAMVDSTRFSPSTIDRLKSVEILTCETPETFDRIIEMLDPCINELQLLSRLRDDNDNITLYGKRNGDKLSSLLLIEIKESPEVLSAIFMTGDIDPDSLKSITRP